MIKIHLSVDDLARMRMAPSPLWETVCSFGVLLSPNRRSLHAPWAHRARMALRGVDLSPLVAAVGVGGRCPDYLSPPPDGPGATFRQELERLGATPPEVVRCDVGSLIRDEAELLYRFPREKERLLGVMADPEGSLKRLVDALYRYHELAIAPYWTQIREHLEGDVLRQAQALALGGAESFLSNLDPDVGYSGGVLSLGKAPDVTNFGAGRGVTLVPCVFSWPNVLTLVGPHYRPTLAYAPRGVAKLWTSSPSSDGTALEAALSPARASVLKGLLTPRTTTELARELSLSPATVSAHLTRLKAAKLIDSHRNGKEVLYRLSDAGEALLEVFGETT